MVQEITAQELNTDAFIAEKAEEIRTAVGQGTAIHALPGRADSSIVTMLGHRALGASLRTVFVDNGLLRQGKLDFGQQIEVRCWDGVDARAATKPPSTTEAV